MIKELRAEAWHVLCLWIIITCGIMVCDIDYRLSSQYFCDNWEYNLDCPIPGGFEKAMVPEPKYKHKYSMKYKTK